MRRAVSQEQRFERPANFAVTIEHRVRWDEIRFGDRACVADGERDILRWA
jgi:hypothetical protein